MLSTLSKNETDVPSLETSALCDCKNGANLRSVTIPPDHLAHAVRFKVDKHRIRPKGESSQATLQLAHRTLQTPVSQILREQS